MGDRVKDTDESDEGSELSEIRAARGRARMMIVAGEHWYVFELRNAYDRRGASLVFESEQIIRVVRQYPSDWMSLSDEELYGLSERR